MTQRKYFGTDGIRGRVGTMPITPDFVLKLGWAAGIVLSQGKSGTKVLIGKDTRISGYMFEAALESGLSAAGIDSLLLGPMPTPAVAYLTQTLGAAAGIVISASHNPYYDNGIKFFSADGLKLPDEIEYQIEQQLALPITTVDSEKLGKAQRVLDAGGRYIEFCKSTVAEKISLRGLKIVVDCANGATYRVAPHVFSELGAEVIKIGTSPNGLNINDRCGAIDTKKLSATVIAEKADLGIALDGDGDRLIMIDHQGEVVDGDELLLVIVANLQRLNRLHGGVVGTLMTNFGFELALKKMGIPFVRTQVGDRYVMLELLQKQWNIGGETSGHIIYLDVFNSGDGIISALQVLSAIFATGKNLHELKQGMQKLPQHMINVKVPNKLNLTELPVVMAAKKAAEKKLNNEGRIVLRSSGTEPVVRVMVESRDAEQAVKIAEELAEVIRNND